MHPSDTLETSTAWSGAPIPTPTKTGFLVISLQRPAIIFALSANSFLAPVVPSNPTAYTKPFVSLQTSFRCSWVVVGAANKIASLFFISAADFHELASIKGRSGRIAPDILASLKYEANLSKPNL